MNPILNLISCLVIALTLALQTQAAYAQNLITPDVLEANPTLQNCFLCLHAKARFGLERSVEQGMWIIFNPAQGDYSCSFWPSDPNTVNSVKFEGDLPAHASWVHTHPRGNDHFSSHDYQTSDKLIIPAYLVTPAGIFSYDPLSKINARVTTPKLWNQMTKHAQEACEMITSQSN